MALSTEQQAVVTEIAALCGKPEDKDALARILAENDAVRGGFLRQADYDRNLNKFKGEIKAKETEMQQTIDKYNTVYDQNVEWRKAKEAELVHAKEVDARISEVEREKQELQAKIEAAVSGTQEGDVKIEEVQKLVDDKIKAAGGSITPEAINKIIAEAVTAKEQEFIANTLPLQVGMAMDMSEIAWQHQSEFGKPIDRSAFSTFCKDRGFSDAKKAFDEFVKPVRDEKTNAEALAKAKADAEAAVRAEFAANQGVPGSGAVPGGPVGAVQARLQSIREAQAKEAAAGAVIPGGAMAAAQELRSAGKV